MFEDCGYVCHILFAVTVPIVFYSLYTGFFKLLGSLKASSLQGKAVLITGCDSGFGKLTSLRLAEKGFLVLSGCLTKDGVAALSKVGPNVKPFLLDVTKEESVNEAFEFVKKNLPAEGLWALINNAGVLRGGPMDVHRLSDIKLQLDVNVIGVMLMGKKFAHLIRKAHGRIVNIASVAGRVGYANASAYCASKYAVEGLSDAWRRELRPWGVNVCIVEPGFMKTNLWDAPLNQKDAEERWSELTPQQQDFYGKEYFTSSFKQLEEMIRKLGGDPVQVVDVLEHAVSARFPQHRYLVGSDTPMWWLIASVPSAIGDLILSAVAKPQTPKALKA